MSGVYTPDKTAVKNVPRGTLKLFFDCVPQLHDSHLIINISFHNSYLQFIFTTKLFPAKLAIFILTGIIINFQSYTVLR